MRRIIHNTTAIAACLSLMMPSLAQAQAAADQAAPEQAEGQAAPPPVEQPEAAPAPEAPDVATPEEPVAEDAAPVEPTEPEPAAEPETAAVPDQEPETEPATEPEEAAESEPEPEPEPAPEAEAEAAPAAEPAALEEAEPEAEAPAEPAAVDAARPAEDAREQSQERPADRPETDTPEQKSERAAERSERQAAEEEATREGQAERPEPAAREQQSERPAEAEREQTRERPIERPADEPPAKAEAPAAPSKDAAEDDLRDALARKQEPAKKTQADQPAPTEAAQQAAQETGGGAAAALNDEEQGEVTEQQITEENSRSSSEDFETNLRDAVAPADQQTQRAENDDDDDNTLAKALLLGLGAVAVGSYLNNNRQVALSAPDRVVVTRPDGSQELIKDEVALLRKPGSTVSTENFDDGSSRTVVTRADGSRVVTIRDADLRVLRRTLVSSDGTQTRLIDDTAEVEPVDIATLPAPAPVQAPGAFQDEAALREALRRQVDVDRRFTLGQIRNIPEVRALVPQINIDAITFDTGSAAITPDQARQLSALGRVIQQSVAENPREVFLIEGHTDTVGSNAANLALSDRRAESVALALSEYFDVPPENLVVQGYGEQFPQIRQEGDVRDNRRAAVRRITGLLQTAEVQ